MPDLDPTSTAALVIRLAAMADDRQFQLDSAETFLRYLKGPYPAAVGLAPSQGESAWLVAYAILYRRQTFRGALVVGHANCDTARAILANDALYHVLSYDVKWPVTEYTAGGRGVIGGP
jgi:hypothetical protein